MGKGSTHGPGSVRNGNAKTGTSRSDRRRIELLERAAQVFMLKGYEGTSMNLIAEHAKVTKPGLYYHFASKQELLASIASHAMDHLEKATREASLGARSNEERLYRILEKHARMITEEDGGSFTLLVIDLADKLPEGDRRLIEHRKRAYFELVRATLEQLRKEGKLRPDVDETVAAFSLLGMIMWLTKWFRPDGKLGKEEVVRKIARMALASVLLDDRREDPAPS